MLGTVPHPIEGMQKAVPCTIFTRSWSSVMTTTCLTSGRRWKADNLKPRAAVAVISSVFEATVGSGTASTTARRGQQSAASPMLQPWMLPLGAKSALRELSLRPFRRAEAAAGIPGLHVALPQGGPGWPHSGLH